MAATVLSIVTCTESGATVTPTSAQVSADTITITPTSAQGVIDFNSLHVRVACTTGLTISVGVGNNFTEVGMGAMTFTVATGVTAIFGGQDFEGSRFQTTSNTVVFTVVSGTGTFEAYQSPNAFE